MKTLEHARLTIRPTATDLRNLDLIANALRANGRAYCTRTDAVRHALAVIAASVSIAPPVAAPR